MNNKYLKISILLLIMLLMVKPVYADVYTVNEFDDDSQYVYIIGNPNFYPIEYYDEKTKRYEGAIPMILKDISKHTGIDFAYLHGNSKKLNNSEEDINCSIVSSYVTDSIKRYVIDKVDMFSYVSNDKSVNIGLAFTHNADKKLIKTLKQEISKLSQKEINGYIIAASKYRLQKKGVITFISVVCCVVLSALIILALTKLRKTKKEIQINKITDLETGIGNIAYFEQCYNNIITDVLRNQYYIIYIIIDSNYLQLYHGEAAFSDAVKYTANVLRSCEKDNDFCARITENGFVFAFIPTNINNVKEEIENIIDKLNQYLKADNATVNPFFHVAAYNLDTTDRNCEFILYNLRRNCNKLSGKDTQLVVCDKYLMNSAIEEQQLLEKIVNGLDNQEFKLYLQFIVDNKTKKIVSCEALSRWESPNNGIIPPSKYIGVMEKSGLITRLDYYMFEMVCRQLHKWHNTEFGDFSISCNFTRITISENDFVSKINEISSKYVFDKSKIIMEITEGAIEENHNKAMKNILKCKKMGFRIALDDLGCGYTSLANLCEYPLDIVKIDRDILLKAEKNGKDLFVGIIALAHSLGLKVVCEGVETKEQNTLVQETNCNYIQGWYYSLSYPQEQAENFAKDYHNKLLNAN